jgi:hypothetical protein
LGLIFDFVLFFFVRRRRSKPPFFFFIKVVALPHLFCPPFFLFLPLLFRFLARNLHF